MTTTARYTISFVVGVLLAALAIRLAIEASSSTPSVEVDR